MNLLLHFWTDLACPLCPYPCLKTQPIYIQLDVEKQCGKNVCVQGNADLQIKTKSCLPPHNLNYHPFIYILSRLSSKKGRTESRQNIVANNLCQFLPFTYTWTRKGKTGLKQNNTNETLVTSFKVAIVLDGIETIDHKNVFTCLPSIV